MTDAEKIFKSLQTLRNPYPDPHNAHVWDMAIIEAMRIVRSVAIAEGVLACIGSPAQPKPEIEEHVAISFSDAREALDSLDDYARMDTGVDAHGPRSVLERFIEQQAERAALKGMP